MKPIYYTAVLAVLLAASCKEKEQKQDIIVPPPAVEKASEPQEMPATNQNREVEWLGSTYKLSIERKADHSLPQAQDENGKAYYDNVITLRIQRPDGTDVLNRSFTKDFFAPRLGNTAMERNGALLGIVFDKVTASGLVFATSIGSPDISSDEFVPLIMTVNRDAGISVKLDTRMDSGNDQPETAEDAYDDDGV